MVPEGIEVLEVDVAEIVDEPTAGPPADSAITREFL
jgi:hypothetical protein